MRKYLTLKEMKQIARDRGGQCLSNEYINSATKLLWQCSENHQWYATPNSVKNLKSWCPFCANIKLKPTIKEINLLAKQKGGRCLSKKYTGHNTKLLWECSNRHQWYATFYQIKKKGSWCPDCANPKITFEKIFELVKQKGGKCLSISYKNKYSKLLWECDKKHQWEASSITIWRGHWCPYCSNTKKLNLNDMQNFAEAQGGKCLSETYINIHSKLLWECSKGHQWQTAPNNIKGGSWCPHCANNNKKLTIEEMQNIAQKRGGKCLSKEYINSTTKMLWQCALGHQWQKSPNYIKSKGAWCPTCKKMQKGKSTKNK